ncbi:replication protein A 32 kDa subunit-A-like [Trichogramma pretiosum]|uniref:replication protein A 32 kDa subunit-A-like n=1 Tax=Trichogramma pretiosum TaxID=7493 RepID=UPI0006C9A4B4|nr:replication protein A 32 kDa subunit-A-like [Trichogramma pretiosum]
MSWNQFDNSTRGEGGFMDTTVNEGAGGDGGDKNAKRGQNCMPVMISHIQSRGEKLEVWGTPAKIITIVAVVTKIEPASTKIAYEFQDETGSIRGIKWLENESSEFISPVEINNYARVYAMIRDQGEEHTLLILSIQPLEHLNELVAHLMEVTLMCLEGQKGISNTQSTTAVGSGGDTQSGSMNPSQKLVLEIIKNGDQEYGAERDEIKAKVPQNLIAKVDEIIEFLSAEGHIYTTKTDDYFKAI